MKKAFTMMELVFVIVIIGILAVATAPKLNDNRLRELAHQIISDIRYTQHLAMSSNEFDPNDSEWHLKRWQIFFHNDGSGNGHKVYTIYRNQDKDKVGNSVETNEIATDQATGRKMTGDSSYSTFIETMDLTDEYGITSYNLCGNTDETKKRLYFDYIGRVYAPDGLISDTNRFDSLITTSCNLKLINDSGNFVTITIEPETGYAYINEAQSNF